MIGESFWISGIQPLAWEILPIVPTSKPVNSNPSKLLMIWIARSGGFSR